MSQTYLTNTHPTISPIIEIDTKPLIENGQSPTSIILAIAILIFLSVGSITELVRVIVVSVVRQTKPPR
jgi:type III secretory pathway component EscT